ncbi:MAG: SurA N-terminal domain-containing protein [Xanthobacteraceae bacterium]|nr:SurA N-terminal domain-containing protein [Xanthobacteraceae bacterium]
MITKAVSSRATLAAAGVLVLVAAFVGSPADAQTVVLMVNGEPITSFDIEQRSKLDALTTHKIPDRESVINELIDQRVKIKEAKKWSIDPSASDVDSLYSAMAGRMKMNADQLSKMLEGQGIRPETLKEKVRADTVWTNLVRGRFKESLLVNEKEVHSAVLVKGDEAAQQTNSFEYTMRPIVLVVPRSAPPSETEARQKEAEALRNRIQSCNEANDVFRSMHDAAIRDNVTKTSADLAGPLREMLDQTPIGHLTPPEITKQGIEMVALCDRKPTTVDSPAKREIRDKMFVQKFEAKSNAYLQEIRKAAMIERR